MVDSTIRNHVCFYCSRPATETWPSGRLTCTHEVCLSLAYAREPHGADAAPSRSTRQRLRHLVVR